MSGFASMCFTGTGGPFHFMSRLGIIAQLVESFLSGCEQREGGSSAGQGAAFWGRGSQLVIVPIQGLPLCASISLFQSFVSSCWGWV